MSRTTLHRALAVLSDAGFPHAMVVAGVVLLTLPLTLILRPALTHVGQRFGKCASRHPAGCRCHSGAEPVESG